MEKWALVTGAAKGLGLAMCQELLEQGYGVLALARRASDGLLALEGDKLKILHADVTDYASLQQACAQAGTNALDVIVNNAGIWLDQARVKLEQPEFDPETILPQLNVNAVGVVRVTKAFLPMLLGGREKLLINISSEAGSIQNAKRTAEYGYCMSKAAGNMATKMLGNALGPKGVRVIAVHPGWMITDMGMAGAKGEIRPRQDPRDSAKKILALAKDQTKTGYFYDINGEEMPW